jgi:hypothetical protein
MIVGLRPFDWLHSILLTPYLWWEYNFLFMPFCLTPIFSGMQLGYETSDGCILKFEV